MPLIATIYDTTKIASVASMMGRSITPAMSPLLLIKPGVDAPPVFVAPGIDGDVAQISQLGALINSGHPIYGIDETGEKSERIEDLARHYLDAIRELQPDGPYLLIGYSFGGLVMLELAHRLTELGEEVALLAMLDSYCHPRFWPLRDRTRFVLRNIKHHISTLTGLSPGEAMPYLVQRCKNLSRHFVIRWRFLAPLTVETSSDSSRQQQLDSRNIAWVRYSPRRYQGKIIFFKAEVATHFPADPVRVWRKFVQDFEVYTVPGDHVGIIATHCGTLAAELSQCLRSACGSK